jgi:hypothetical protein
MNIREYINSLPEERQNRIQENANQLIRETNMSVEVYQKVVDEHEELYAKYEALQKMLDKPQPNFISDRQWKLLKKQEKHMRKYNRILAKRVEDLYDENYAELETKTLLG